MEIHSSIEQQPSLRYGWWVVALLTLANICSFVDRQILALLVQPIKRDMHLSDTRLSLLMGLSFALFYTVFGIIISRLADNTNRRNIIMTGIALWSLLTALCAGVKNYTQFFLARVGVGVGEATLSPSAYSIITDYFPKRKLGLALSTFSIGIFLGSGLALAIGAGLVAHLPTTGTIELPILGRIFHWQKLFLLIGGPGILISLLLFTIKEPARKDLLQLAGGNNKPDLVQSLRLVFAHPRTFLSICIGTAFTAFVSYGCTAWAPTYFLRTFGWPVPKAGLRFGLVLLTGSICGALWGGWYADRLRNKGIQHGRLRIGLIAGAGIFLCSLIPLIRDPNIVLACMFMLLFFVACPMGASTSAIQELMPNQIRALASAIFLFIINMIGMGLGPLIVAFFTDSIYKDEMAIKYSMVALMAIGGLSALLFYSIGYLGYKKIILHSFSQTVALK
jgi:MFS family permease